MSQANLSTIFYLISGILFILAVRGLSTARNIQDKETIFGMAGMAIAIIVTF